MTLTEARQAVAAVLSDVGNFNVRARPMVAPKTFDGWVVVNRITPSDFSHCYAELTAVLTVGSDEAKAEELFETYGTTLVDAVTSNLNATDISLEPQALVVGNPPASMFALALTMTLEVG